MACHLSAVMQKWLDAADSYAELRSYLRDMVPRTYHLDTVLDPQEEERVQKCLLHPLECFLFGEDPEEGLAKLKQGSESSGICGRVFKEGETVYSCRDCAIDPTCVLCMDCFQENFHGNNAYFPMHASSGGGFCDCGDLEAWKIGPCCAIHDQGTAVAMETDASVLDPVLHERAEQLFRCLLRYVTEMLVWEKYYELPEDLEPRVDEEVYLCVLYNDDHHSFDHVIYSLQRSIKCTQAVAQAHTALIDKEGRWIVKKGTVLACQEVNDLIESNSKHISQEALRVEVLLYAVVAHQTFALRLGNWFQKIVGYSGKSVKVSALAHLISADPVHPGNHPVPFPVSCLISRTLFFWSLPLGARRIVYELIFCSLLMDTESKRLFAIEFTKNYDMLQQCFIFDYHDRSIFISSLSVQIFTVPTLARHLIEEAKVIKVIVGTIMEVLKGHLCDSNRFQFQGYNSDKFFRIHVIFHDLRYILISKPTEWTDALRTAFLEGFKAFLDLLGCMQGMEEVKRQFGQHIEVEPEWEAGFSLQIQLRHILSMFQDWCASDETVLLQAFRECHGALIHCNHRANQSEPTDFYMCKQILHIRPYKVSQEPVSIHLPISRLFAGLYLHLCRTGAIERLHQHVDPASYDYTYLAEHSLRCLVLVAQVSAEMWRRNGLSLVSQVYYYQDVKCRDEMYDKDVLMLQIAASKMDPNHFLMLLLLRFELFDVFNGSTSGKDQELLKQWNRLTEEMLFLLIVIIGERYVPGVSEVTKEDVTMREVIHLLCIEPMAHSGLVKGLPENESHETGLESVISKVSNFKKPGVSGHGLYEVKKECLPEFNPFFYHYSKSQHSKAEDSQKKRRAQEGTDQALRPPVPPAFCPAFSSVVRLLSCDIFVHILRRVLQRAAKDRSTQWTEAMVQRALHLIGQALLEEKSQLEAAADEEVAFDFSVKARLGSEHSKSVFQLLTKVKSLPALEGHSDMVKWILQVKRRVELYMCLAPGGWRAMNRPKALPSSLLSPQVAQDKDKAERKRKADAAKLHRQKIMAQMSAMQRNFIESNKMLYDNMPDSSSSHPGPAQRERCVALGPQRGSTPAQREVLTCILCQEEQEVAALSQAMVLTACVQRSTVLTQCRGKALAPSNSLFMSPELVVGTHTGSCGHIMHSSCWQKYFEAIQNTTRNRLHAELIIDLENGQYLCPLCKSLCNTVVPLVPLEPLTIDYENAEIVGQHLTLPRWILILLARINGLKSINHSSGEDRSDRACDRGNLVGFSDSIAEMLVVCATTVHRVGLETPPNELCPHVPTMAWNTCAFTIQAIGEPSRTHDAPPLSPVLLPTISRENTPSILEVDFFHLLVGMVLSVPALYHEEAVELQPSAVSSAYNHLYILHLVTMAHLVQVLLTSGTTTTAEKADLKLCFVAVAEGVKRAITPFLRCTALFFNGLTGVPPPVEISSTAGHSGALCSYLALPSNLFQLFWEHRESVRPLLQRWCQDPAVTKAQKGEIQTVRYPRRRNHLIDLPADYSSLLNQASHFKCPKSNDGERKHPTLCLVCGTMLCSQSTCCQSQLEGEDVGACTAHAATCGAGVGVFLSIRECEIVLKASKTRGSTYPAPYLDDYGETDPQLVRGNPLHLCPERYKKLHQLWQQHCVLEEIARSLEVDNVMFALEWQML
uniref:E3 ubiquitin-protein ligase n=1 Tax=Gadus morhua TaxID=8049 RepID=A0A8C5C7P9_GADMO